MDNIYVYRDAEAVAQAVVSCLSDQIKSSVSERGQCHVALPGGSTPMRCLELLSERSLPWKQVHWYPGDERCYPAGHAQRNDSMMMARLFSREENIIENFHPIPAELGPEAGARQYSALIDAIDRLDIALLGMGEDGHTASLFPGNKALDDSRSVVPVYDAPKSPAERISIGLPVFRNAGERIVIVTGKGKHDVLLKIRRGALLPVALVEPNGWFVDEAAFGEQ